MARLHGSKGQKVKGREPLTPEQKEQAKLVDQARPPELRGKQRAGRPDHLKNPNRVAAQAKKRKKFFEATGDGCPIPLESRRKGGQNGNRQGVPDGETKLTIKKKMELADEMLLARMAEDIEKHPALNVEVSPYLPEAQQKELGLSVNPLWLAQRVILSGTLTPKEEGVMLLGLAKFTHSPATTKQHITTGPAEELLDAVLADAQRKEKVIEGQVLSG